MIVSHSKKIVYLAPPKTGSTSIRKLLLREPFNAEIVGDHHHHDVVWTPNLRDYNHFITVRHPYSRMYSLWRMACWSRELYKQDPNNCSGAWRGWYDWFPKRPPTLDEFVRSKVGRPPRVDFRRQWRCSWHLEQIPKEIPVVVVRLENFYEDLQQVEPLRDNLHHVVHANKNLDKSPKHWSEVVTPEHAERIRELWREDFDRFGYTESVEEAKQLK